jgi:tRNA(adenine34) deaminase
MIDYAQFYMKKAIEAAIESNVEEVPVGCILVKDEKIIASSCNTTKESNHVVSHAEINVIQRASIQLNDWRLDGCDLFVTMEPCLMCLGAIMLARIRSVYYGISNPITGAFHGELPVLDSKLKTLIIAGVLEEEIKDRMQSFFSRQRNKKMKKN